MTRARAIGRRIAIKTTIYEMPDGRKIIESTPRWPAGSTGIVWSRIVGQAKGVLR